MDPVKVSVLFDELPGWADPDDREDRAALLADRLGIPEDASSGELFRLAVYETVATQIAEEDPPEVWATASRLLDAGLDRESVLGQLVMALLPRLSAAVGGQEPFDRDAYVDALTRLPLPSVEELEELLCSLVRRHQPVGFDDLEEMASAELGYALEEEPYRSLMDRVTEELTDPDGPLLLLCGDRVVDPNALCAGAVLTHRLSDTERALGFLSVSVDLAGFNRLDTPVLAGSELDVISAEPGHVAWHGPEGWLDPYPTGALLAVRAVDGSVSIEVVSDDPEPDPSLVAALRAVYDAEVDEPGLPVPVEDLVCGLLADDRNRFASPQAPLRDLIEAAGLELRGSEVAHDRSVWQQARTTARIGRIVDALDTPDSTRALEVLEAFDQGDRDPQVLRRALANLADLEVADVVAAELLDEDDAAPAEEVAAFADALVGAARRPGEVAPARWLAALAAERAGDVHAAEALLHLAVEAGPGWEPAVDRLAWYLSDRGRAAEAARLWRSIGLTHADSDDLSTVEPLARAAGPKLGRNDPCWCGSGRKHKVCHLGEPPALPLPDRVGWLARKAVAYLERAGGQARDDVFVVAAARAGSAEPDRLRRAMSDPVVLDLVLTEGGWFARFLEQRASLLPEDEALLAASWVLVDRTLYEILDVRPGEGISVRDLRTADVIDVAERTFSRQAQPGTVVCGRAVPDGASHQIVGAIFPVRAGGEAELLDLLDEGDPEALAAYLGALERPPTLVTRENEPLVVCKAVLSGEHKILRDVLDANYRREDDHTWLEMHSLGPHEEILRATLHLEGDTLTLETMSEPRLERVLSALRSEVPEITVVSDQRRPLKPGEVPPTPRHLQQPDIEPDDVPEAVEAIQDQMERRWCDESVPALGGLTPRQAAADPAGRETLERLLAEFERADARLPAGGFSMRPARLRQLLGLGH
ncbi:MAG TPA: SEC-C metal-binding domain-containing protein [Acidimicrobiales bacterium]|nr:SEC-C metal-binding domain-containing protein [Acidimicrobiales bacterium]